MIALTCPFCGTPLQLDAVVGAQQHDCASCTRPFWVELGTPSVSTSRPRAAPDTSSTVSDLGPGVGILNKETVVGLRPVGARPREGDRVTLVPEPAHLGEVADLPTMQRPLPAFLSEEQTDPQSRARVPLAHDEVDPPLDVTVPPRRTASSARKLESKRRLPTQQPRVMPPRSSPSGFAQPPPQAAPGMTLGGLQLLARIGGGGMGTVWLARQISLDRNVAVKILRPHLGDDPAFVIQFTREALAAAQLVHHNIAQIYDIGLEQQLHYFSMEYVEGESLSALLKREGRLDPEVAAGYVLQAARGLEFAHDAGHDPPRHQAREPAAQPRRHRQGGRPRPGQAPGRAPRRAAEDLVHRGRSRLRCGQTGSWAPRRTWRPSRCCDARQRRRARRHLLAGLHPLRPAHRPAALRGRERRRRCSRCTSSQSRCRPSERNHRVPPSCRPSCSR